MLQAGMRVAGVPVTIADRTHAQARMSMAIVAGVMAGYAGASPPDSARTLDVLVLSGYCCAAAYRGECS